MRRIKLIIATLLLMSPFAANATLIVNGDFEGGTLAGWTTFTQTGGEVGGAGWPMVISFDTTGSGASLAAAFRPGHDGGGGRLGGGIFQDIVLGTGSLTLMADAAMLDNVGFDNADGGIVEMLLDGLVVASHDYGDAILGVTETTMLASVTITTAGLHELRFQFRRSFTSESATPVHYLDNITASGTATNVPEPGTLALLGIGLAGMGVARRRRKV